jgi:hypothetical protein
MGGFRYLLRSPTGRYLGEYIVAVPDWSEGDTFTDKEGRRFRIVSTDPGARRDPRNVDGRAGLDHMEGDVRRGG